MHTHFRINANGELIVYPFCDHAEDNVKKYFLEFLDNPDINQNDTIKISGEILRCTSLKVVFYY